MCGIAAILRGASSDPLERRRVQSVLEAMTRSLDHRGPDGEGFFYGRQAALGHRRLAIIDLVAGDQPMASEDDRIQVIFNGEIYNHRALRRDLEAEGCRFRTRSDTEVLVHGFRVWGSALVDRLVGMFAFLAHDQETGRTLIARDPIGKKPLFYTEEGELLLLASEARAFLGLPGFRRALDPDALRELLALRYVPGARTLLDGVFQLPPGHLIEHVPGRRLVPRPYWRPSFRGEPPASIDDAADRLRELLQTCVDDRLESDVPLGAFLSGGVDSSAVVVAMSHRMADRLEAVTVGFEETAFDERPFAREIAQRLGIRMREEVCRPDPIGDLGALQELFDLPQTDSSAWPTWLVCRAARRHVTVALSGDGGDESFAGYRRYRFDLLENRLRSFIPKVLARTLAAVLPKGDWLPRPLRMKRTMQDLAIDPVGAYCRSVSALVPEELDEFVLPEVGGGVDPFRELRETYGSSEAPDHGSRVLDLDLRTYLPGDILTKVDRCSMAVSLEVRAPLLDRRMIDAAAALPLHYKVDGSGGKKVLKRALEPWLGQDFMQRPKQGFSIPLAAWLRGPLRDRCSDAIRGAFAQRFFRVAALHRLQQEHDSGRRDRSEVLWAVLVFHLWNERWGKQA